MVKQNKYYKTQTALGAVNTQEQKAISIITGESVQIVEINSFIGVDGILASVIATQEEITQEQFKDLLTERNVNLEETVHEWL